MITIDPNKVSQGEFHGHLLRAVAPRPIAFASTIAEDGTPNLAPYSFFNAFSSNPPTLVFSSNLKGTDGSSKDTLNNIKANGEVVVNVVSYSIVKQMALASVAFDSSVNEFEKAGFTPIASETVKPFRVKESPVQMECKVKDIIKLGDQGGAGNLFICEIQLMHIDEKVLDETGKIDLNKIELCGRMGGFWYVKASGDALFEMPQPVDRIIIGIDQLPNAVKNSSILTGSNLAQLADVTAIPAQDANFVLPKNLNSATIETLHRAAQVELSKGNIEVAWQILLSR